MVSHRGRFWRWSLWLLLSAVIVGAFLPATRPGEGFFGESGRILYFHVPNAWASFVAFIAAGIWSLRYLFGGRSRAHDRAAGVAVELGLLFCVLATVTGAIWARVQWGAYWNWDPRQTSITLALLFYAAYLALRGAIAEPDTRGRLSAAYAALGLVVAPFFFFVLPRITFSLHPQPVVNASGTIDMARPMLIVLLAGAAGFTGLFFWLHRLRCAVED
jgi:heme exporter protein C